MERQHRDDHEDEAVEIDGGPDAEGRPDAEEDERRDGEVEGGLRESDAEEVVGPFEGGLGGGDEGGAVEGWDGRSGGAGGKGCWGGGGGGGARGAGGGWGCGGEGGGREDEGSEEATEGAAERLVEATEDEGEEVARVYSVPAASWKLSDRFSKTKLQTSKGKNAQRGGDEGNLRALEAAGVDFGLGSNANGK